jgi:predicted lipoprotein
VKRHAALSRRAWLGAGVAAAGAAWLAPRAAAQPDWRRVAVPAVSPAAWLHSLEGGWVVPLAATFAESAAELAVALDGPAGLEADRCLAPPARDSARAAWRKAMLDWERLVAVPLPPLIERRALRTLDFQPARPAAIERAIATGAGADLALVGAPAKGLPALEWLLWRAPVALAAGAASCGYARRLAAELAAEATALAGAAASLAAAPTRDEAAVARDFALVINQLVAGAEALRWAQIGRPRREGRGPWPRGEASGQSAPTWPREASASTAAAWQGRAEALRTLLAWSAPAAPAAAGAPRAPVSLEAFLRGQGRNALADRVRAAASALPPAVARAQPGGPAAALVAAERAAAGVKAVIELEVAPALAVAIGFSDADGD